MEARFIHAIGLMAILVSLGASYRTTNFIVDAPRPELAREIGDSAERMRHDLAMEWLGKAMPPWAQPCMLTANVSPRLGAGGATSFVFEHREVFGWRMTIQGSRERILDSVLPHEITHTVFACHFRQALPRWADEGACTTVEHVSERSKQDRMLITFLKTGHGISFSQMFAMKEYPADVLPLYSQGYSLTRFLLAQGGKQKFLQFVGTGLESEDWSASIRQHYGYKDLLVLQNTWLSWVRRGSPAIPSPTSQLALGQGPVGKRALPATDLVYRTEASQPTENGAARLVPVTKPFSKPFSKPVELVSTEVSANGATTNGGWRASGSPPSGVKLVAAVKPVAPPASKVRPQDVARPQPIEKARQIILQWDRPAKDTAQKSPIRTAIHGSSLYGNSVKK